MAITGCYVDATTDPWGYDSKWCLKKDSSFDPFGAYHVGDTVRIYSADKSVYGDLIVIMGSEELSVGGTWILRCVDALSATWYGGAHVATDSVLSYCHGPCMLSGYWPDWENELVQASDAYEIGAGTAYEVGFPQPGGEFWAVGLKVDVDGAVPWTDLISTFGPIGTEPVYSRRVQNKDALWDIFGQDTAGIIIEKPANAAFSASPLSGKAPLAVRFTNESTG